MGVRSKRDILDQKRPGEGRLILTLHDENGIQIGDTRVFLDRIMATGESGGRRAVRLVFIGPKETQIKRLENVKVNPTELEPT